MTAPTVLLTGPIGNETRWLAAAREAGWNAVSFPLLEIHDLDANLVDRVDGLPDWIAVTSSNALGALERALDALPELRSVPAAVVGALTAERVAALGLSVKLGPARAAEALAQALVEAGRAESVVLWPRGSRSDSLAILLRKAGWLVNDQVVYETVSSNAGELPEARAIFFASPSAVRAYAARPAAATPAPVAIAIGPTTSAALQTADAVAFSDTISLPEPAPKALREALLTLAPTDS